MGTPALPRCWEYYQNIIEHLDELFYVLQLV